MIDRTMINSPRGSVPGRERGAAAVELALLIPAVVLVVAVLVGGARVWFARATVTDAAGSAARAASLARTRPAAQAAGAEAVRASLSGAGLDCGGEHLQLDLAGLNAAVGTPAQVRAELHCEVALADLTGWGIPGSITVHGSAVQAVDSYRSRNGG